MTIQYLQAYIKSKDHHPENTGGYFFKLMEEVGELAEAMRKGLRPAHENEIKNTVEEELWDVMYYLLAIANCYDIDLEHAIRLKEEINNRKYDTGIELEA